MRRPWYVRLRRYIVANLRVVILLWRRFRLSLSLFLAIIVVGTLIVWLGYLDPDTHLPISFGKALYAVFGMLFLQSTISFPEGPMEILFFVIPILGLSVVAQGLISFSLLLLDRRNPSGEWTVALASTYSGHVVVCGLGHVGFRVLRQLLEFGQEVVAIEQDTRVAFIERAQRAGAPVVAGDATDLEVLRQAGTERAQAIVVATNNDLVNLEVVVNARQLNPGIRVVLRMFDADLAEKMGSVLGVQMALSASAIAAPAFATAAIHSGVTHSFFLEGELLNVSEVVVRPAGQLAGWTVQRLEDELDLSVVFHQRGENRDMRPPDSLQLQGGDKVVVFATLEQLGQLERLNCPRRKREQPASPD
jgi:voltage-gated potassium channel